MQLILFLSEIITGFEWEEKSLWGPYHDFSISPQVVYQWSYILDKVAALTRLINLQKRGLTRNNTVAVYKTKASRLKSEQVKRSFS